MRKKLLLADDSITIQKVIGIIFATEDYDLSVADNGDEAFDKALAELPDLVISDIIMPGKNGFELCEAIKSDSRFQHTSVLLLPGTFETFDEKRAEAVGADGWISKPFESQSLLDKVTSLLGSEPVRLSEDSSAEPEEFAEPLAEESLEDIQPEADVALATEDSAAEEPTAVDETVLGLDAVDEPEIADLSVAEDDSADDIWDAVSFEEEDLQQADGLAAPEADFVEEFTAAEEDLSESVAEESDFK